MIEALIFDLDSCLAPAMEIGTEPYGPSLEAIEKANLGTLSSNALEEAINDIWSHPFDLVANKHGFSTAMIEAGIREFGKIETPGPFHGYGDLSFLDSFDIPLFLVTFGFRRLQESKVRALGIVDHFLEVVVDAIDEPEARIRKRALSKGSWIFTDFRETESSFFPTASIRKSKLPRSSGSDPCKLYDPEYPQLR